MVTIIQITLEDVEAFERSMVDARKKLAKFNATRGESIASQSMSTRYNTAYHWYHSFPMCHPSRNPVTAGRGIGRSVWDGVKSGIEVIEKPIEVTPGIPVPDWPVRKEVEV